MAQQSFLDKVREWIGGVAFDIFLWSARMTADEYFAALDSERRPTPREDARPFAGAGSLRHFCPHGYNGQCPECDAMQMPPRS